MRTLLEAHQIPEGAYTGYYWLSNAQKPELVSGSFSKELLQQVVPFVVEGNLFNADSNQSFSIRHNGEKHLIYQYDLNNLASFEKHPVAFIAHRLPQKGRVKFWELWQEEADPLCAGLKTLKPYGRVFVGFEKN